MRLLIIAAISLSTLISGAFAQSESPTVTPSDRAAVAKRETRDLEKARLIDALRNSTLRMQAQSQELEKLGQQIETPGPGQTPTLESTEQQHPEWFSETNTYKPCPWNICPSPPPQ
jgi:hypothetical protein